MHWSWRCLLVAALCLLPRAMMAERPAQLKYVSTAVSGKITDLYRQPIRFSRGVQIVFFKFHQRSWDSDIWVHIITQPNGDGSFNGAGTFPIDSTFIVTELLPRVTGRARADIEAGIMIFDFDNHVINFPDGIRLELTRFGVFSWPSGTSAVIKGRPDDTGRMWPKMNIPIDATTIRNFTLLANGRGQ